MEPTIAHTIHGDGNTVTGDNTAGRDIHISHNTYHQESTELRKVALDGYRGGNYVAPLIAAQHTQMALQSHFLVFHGGQTLHLPSYVKHLATRLLDAQPAYQVLELVRGTRSVQTQLREFKEPTILLVLDITPGDILSNPLEVSDLASSNSQLQHYVLCTTSKPQDQWLLPPHSWQMIWQTIPSTGLFDPQMLMDRLMARIDLENIVFAANWATLDRDAAIATAARDLGSPLRVDDLIAMLRLSNRPIDAARFADMVKDANGDKSFAAWFHEADEKEKLILLAASLFQGLDEHQFFQLVDDLVADRWQYRVQELKAIDYCDLDNLSHICRFEQVPGEENILVPQVANYEMVVLGNSMRSYRRHILAAMPIMVLAVERSLGLGHVRAPMRLRRQLALSLGRLASLVPDEVLPLLEILAGKKPITLRRVAAQALASWRSMDELEMMCRVVDAWMDPDDNKDAVRYTAAMTLAFAAEQDTPNHLHVELLNRLKACMADGSPGIRSFIKDLIPNLLRNHPLQIAPIMLEEVLGERQTQGKRDLINPVARGLANAAMDYPKVMLPYMQAHITDAIRDSDQTGKAGWPSHRDRKLVAVTTAFSYLKYPALQQWIDPADVLKQMVQLRVTETQPYVRGSLMRVILHLMRLDNALNQQVWEQLFSDSVHEERIQLIRAMGDLIEDGRIVTARPYFEFVLRDLAQQQFPTRLDTLAALITIWPKHYKANDEECIDLMAITLQLYRNVDRIHFVQVIGQIYLDCRATLQGGDFEQEVQGRQIPIFRQNRPQTSIEQHMLRWIASPIRQPRKTALMAFMEFARILEMAERNAIANWVPPIPGTSAQEVEVSDEAQVSNAQTSTALPPAPYLPFTVRVPLRVKIIGCLCVLFAPKEERKRFWQAVHVIYGRPVSYGIDAVRHTVLRLHVSNLDIPHGLGNRLSRLREWANLFNANL